MNNSKKEIINVAGLLQVCAGQETGAEAAIHEIYNDEHSETVLLVDAENAFNSINSNVMLHNISALRPTISTYASNYYQSAICNRWGRDIVKRRNLSTRSDIYGNIRTGVNPSTSFST